MSEPQPHERALLPWSIGRVAGRALVVALAFLVVSVLLGVITTVVITIDDPAFDPQQPVPRVPPAGLQVWVSTIGAAFACIPLVLRLTARFERFPGRFIIGRPVTWRTLAFACLAVVAFALASDLLTVLLGRPIVSPFMSELHASTHPLPLLIAMVVAAPLLEEVFFRSFVLGGLVSSGSSARAAAAVSSLAWAAVHLQYDLYGLATIFCLGLLLAWVRMVTGSLLPCIAMHALANLYGFAQIALVASPAGA